MPKPTKYLLTIFLVLVILYFPFTYVRTLSEAKQKASRQQNSHISNSEYYIVKLKDSAKKDKVKHRIESAGIQASEFKAKKNREKFLRIKTSSLNELKKLQVDSEIQHIEKDKKRKIAAIPDDSYYTSSGNFIATQYDQWNLRKIGLLPTDESPDSGWKITTGSTNVAIAVIDTGIDTTHPDLSPKLWINSSEIAGNNIDDDGNGYIDDINGYNFADQNNNLTDIFGHGTHVGGIAAASTNNSAGVAGTCWSCKIMVLKVINSGGVAYDSDISDAIEYAVDNGAKVINMSLGGPGYSDILETAVDYAWNHDVLVVSAAGNYGSSASDSYPGGTEHSLSVGSTTFLDTVPSYSNTGAKLDITAPGDQVLSTYLSGAGCVGNTRYDCLSGTSMATPHVAGSAGLLYSLHPTWNAKQIRYALLNSPDKIGGFSGFDNTYGFGRLNALSALNSSSFSSDTTAPTASLNPISPAEVQGTIQITGTASDSNIYIYTVTITRTVDNYVIKQMSGRTSVSNSTLASLDTTAYDDGNYQISLKVEDFAGNSTNAIPIQVTFDNAFTTTSPSLSQLLNTTRPSFSWSTPVSFSASSYEIFIDSNSYATTTQNNYTPANDLPQGTHSWYVVAHDSGSNTRTTNTGSFNIDTLPPNDFTISISQQSSSATATFSTNDSNSGISFYDISIDGGDYAVATSPYSIGSKPDGNHTVTVRAHDNAGNVKSSTATYSIDTRTPYLRSKADFNIDGKVDLSDLSMLAQNWQKSNSSGDATGDGKVDLSDLSILASNWQRSF